MVFYLTDDDARYFEEVAGIYGFKSRSQMFTAIAERLVTGGMSGLAFAKIGWQFANLNADKKIQAGFYFGVRPFPPLIGDEEDPSGVEIVPFLEGLTKEAKKEKAA